MEKYDIMDLRVRIVSRRREYWDVVDHFENLCVSRRLHLESGRLVPTSVVKLIPEKQLTPVTQWRVCRLCKLNLPIYEFPKFRSREEFRRNECYAERQPYQREYNRTHKH